jgi:two-component system response regulator PilR (NtrC family)
VARILIVDDEQSMQEFLEILLQRDGHDVTSCSSAEEALIALDADEFDLALSDIRMPGLSGLELLQRIQERYAETLVILITAHGTTESAVEAMKRGAYDYLTKPFSVDEIRLVIQKALEKKSLSAENQLLRRQLRDNTGLPAIVGKGRAIQEVLDLVRQVSPTKANIMITGESGTGKELIARAIHSLSDRRDRPFVTVNCGAIPENLLESELFGHLKGSFTGAIANKMGLFEVAEGGTLFLDEIGEMSLGLQVKLLRAIQDKTFKRVGGTADTRVDVRICCATNRDLAEEVRAGRFREDLFYRLNVIEIKVPALRERCEDIPLLAGYFISKYAEDVGREIREVAPDVIAALEEYPFPGNVRELENLIERAVTLAHGSVITLDCLPSNVLDRADPRAVERVPAEGVDLEALLREYERSLLREALERAYGVKKRAAGLLGISFRSFRYRLEKLGLESPGVPGDSERDDA